MAETKPEYAFGEGLNAPNKEERHEEFTDRADALLRWKQKTANIIDPEERTELPKKDFAQPKKIDPTTETKGKYPIPDRQHAKSALGFAKMHGDAAAYAAVRKKVEQKYPDMIGKEAAKGKLSEMEKHTSKCGDCGMKMKKCACGATKTAQEKVAISLGKIRAATKSSIEAGGLKRFQGARWKAHLRNPGGVGQTAASKAKEDAVRNTANRTLHQLKGKAKTASVRDAFIGAVNPTFAASSVNARKGELVVKTAGTKETAKRVLQFIKTNPYARDAAVSGTAGAAMGAAQAPPGARLRGAARGGAIGAGGGMIAGEMFRQLQKSAEMEDPRAVLAGKLPEKGLPKPALEKDIDDIKHKLLGTVEDYRDIRTQLTTGPKEKKVRLPKPPPEVMEKLKVAGLKDLLKDPATLTAMGLGGLAGGTGTYLASRPKKSLGGKSSGEVDLENLVSAQKARGEEGASFPRRLKNRYVEFSKGLATDFRKSPGSAAAMGAISGATAGALAAKMLGAGK